MAELGQRPDVVQRFWDRVAIGDADDCWPIDGYSQKSGHRQFWLDGRMQRAHRVAWEIMYGPIPAGMCVCHRCDNPPCVNTRHLFLGSVEDNNADRDRKGRGKLPPPELIVRRQAGPIKHGTITGYVKRKCRCDACIQANSTYRARKRAAKIPVLEGLTAA